MISFSLRGRIWGWCRSYHASKGSVKHACDLCCCADFRRAMTERLGSASGQAQAPGKVNLRLRIEGRRADGYHLLDSDIVPVEIFDELRVLVTPDRELSVVLDCSPPLDGGAAVNLAVRAAEMFLGRIGRPCRVELSIRKEIPVGAGLGGGSSDAAAVLKILNALTGAEVPIPRLMQWGLELGADVPFFLFGRPARARGIGERLEPLRRWPSSSLVVASPGWGLSTAEVYRAYDSLTIPRPTSRKQRLPLGDSPCRKGALNDLEPAALRLRPELERLRGRLSDLGACETGMSGSGTAMFGFWANRQSAERAAEEMRNDGIWARAVGVLDRVPEPSVD